VFDIGGLLMDLQDLLGRRVDQAKGRFTQEDPIGLAGGMNLYGFGGGDPVNFSDPFGLCPPQSRDLTDCQFVQKSADWAARNGHTGLLNAIAGVDAVLTAIGETTSMESGGIGGPAGAGIGLVGKGEAATYLYQKLGAAGEHLKVGITKNLASRYSAAGLAGGRLNVLAQGAKDAMLALERSLHEALPIGSGEGQRFYIEKQAAKGLKTPPYEP